MLVSPLGVVAELWELAYPRGFGRVAGYTTVERLDDQAQEFPRLDDRRTGRRHRYGYFSSRGRGASCLLKQDLDRHSSERYDYGPGRFGMEAVFQPCAPDASEDDGWLMAYVSDMTTDTADVVILHAQDLAAGPMVTIHLPQRVPMGFHGNWVPDEAADGLGPGSRSASASSFRDIVRPTVSCTAASTVRFLPCGTGTTRS
jgi:hypothetical protein